MSSVIGGNRLLYMGYLTTPMVLDYIGGPRQGMVWWEYRSWLKRQPSDAKIASNNPDLAGLFPPERVLLVSPNAAVIAVSTHPLWPKWQDLMDPGEFAMLLMRTPPSGSLNAEDLFWGRTEATAPVASSVPQPVHTCERSADDPRVGGWQEPGTPLPKGTPGDKIQPYDSSFELKWNLTVDGWYAPSGTLWPAGSNPTTTRQGWRWVVYDGQPVQAHYDSTCKAPGHEDGIHVPADTYHDWSETPPEGPIPPDGEPGWWFCGDPCARAFAAERRLEQAHKALDGLVDRNRTDHGAWQEVGIGHVPLPAKLDDRIAVRTSRWGEIEVVAGEITDALGQQITWMREKGGEPPHLTPGDSWRWVIRDGVHTNDPMEGAVPIPLDERIREALAARELSRMAQKASRTETSR